MLAWVALATASASCLKRCSDGGIGGQVGAQDFESDLAFERALLGEIDLAHAAAAEPAQNVDNRRGCGR